MWNNFDRKVGGTVQMKWVTRRGVAHPGRGCDLGAAFAGVVMPPCGLLNNELANGVTGLAVTNQPIREQVNLLFN